MRMFVRAVGALFAAGSALFFSSAQAAAVGTTAGTFEVTPGGAATYSIPLTLPPGTAGMQPSLAIGYDSQGDNGLLGVGFALSGLSTITRCSMAYEPDGSVDGVDFDTNDRFCLDGQRLVVMNGAAYGAVGAEYRTEIESFDRIVSFGGSAGNPSYFKIWTKAGLIMEYGFTTDSRWEVAGLPPSTPGSTVRVCEIDPETEMRVCWYETTPGYTHPLTGKIRAWGVNKVEDASGNYYTVAYSENTTTGEVTPQVVNYTGSPGYSPHASIAFIYESRTDTSARYVGGALVTESKRLSRIETNVGVARVRTYRLDYQQDGHVSVSRLQKVTECDANGDCSTPYTADYCATYTANCFAPTRFEWTTPGSYAPLASELGTPNHYVADGNTDAFRSLARYQWGDFNADGRADLYYIAGYGDSSEAAQIYLSGYNVSGPGGGSAPMTGVTHFVGAGGDWGGCGETWCTNTDTRSLLDVLRIRLGDLNGDGFTDVMVVRGFGNAKPVEIYLNNRAGGFHPVKYGPSIYIFKRSLNDAKRGLNRVRLLDMNADGLADIYVVEGDGSTANGKIYINTGDGNFAATALNGPASYVSYDSTWANVDVNRVKYGDFNGDGLTDVYLVQRDPGSNTNVRMAATIFLQNSNGTFGSGIAGPVHYVSDNNAYALVDINRVQIADFNGDGNSDVLSIVDEDRGSCPTKSPMKIYLSRGDGSFLAAKNGPMHCVWDGLDREERDVSRIKLADLNGDGLTDIYIVDGVNTTMAPALMYINNGNAEFLPEIYGPNHKVDGSSINEALDIARVSLADVTGDGAADVYVVNGWATWAKAYLYRLSVTTGDRVVKVTNGLGAVTEVDYRLMTDPDPTDVTNARVYSKGQDIGPIYPLQNVQGPTWLTAVHRITNPSFGMTSIGHSYKDAKVHLKGRGYLGLAEYSVRDGSSQLTETTVFNLLFPLTGTPASSLTQSSAGVLAESSTTYAPQPQPPLTYGRYFVAPISEVAKTREINAGGSVVTSTVTDSTFETTCGNLTGSTIKAFAGDVGTSTAFQTQTIHEYEVQAVGTCHGRLETSTVKRSGPNILEATRTTSFEYFATGLLKAETVEPAGQWLRTEHTRDLSVGNIETTTVTGSDITARSTTYTYDDRRQFLSTVTNALGHVETHDYDPMTGALESVRDPNNRTTYFTYDGFGRKTLEARPDGTTTSTTLEWCPATGTPLCASGARYRIRTEASTGAVALAEYDVLERAVATRTRTFDGSWASQLTEYNVKGQVKRKAAPHFSGQPVYWTNYEYDAAGRMYKETAPVSQDLSADTRYDFTGLVTVQTNAKGQRVTNTVNALGKVVSVVDDEGNLQRYEYDAFDNLVKTVDPFGNEVVMGYDIRGRKISMSDPDMGNWTYTYNALGELTSQRDANNQTSQATTQMSYDVLGRMLSRTDADGTVTTWTYDGAWKGALARVSSTNGYARDQYYDALGRPTTVDYTIGGTYSFHYNYDAQGRVIRITYPGGLKVGQEYNAFGFMSRVSASDSATGIPVQCSGLPVSGGATVDACQLESPASFPQVWRLDTTDALGSAEEFALGSTMDVQQLHDLATGRLRTLMAGAAGQPAIQSLFYEWDALGNLASRQDVLQGGLTEVFSYDTLNRMTLARVAASGTTEQTQISVDYDPIGNIRFKSDVGAYSYGARPHAVTSVSGARPATYTYDANGNMLSGAGRSLTWTSFNLPATISRGANQTTYTYGPDRERIRQSTTQSLLPGSMSKDVVYAGGLYEAHSVSGYGAGNFGKSYVRAGGRVVAVFTKPASGAGSFQYLHYDHLDSVEVVTNEQGVVLERLSYDAFGKRRSPDWLNDTSDQQLRTPHQTDRGYTGQEHIDGVGLIHYGGRVYDPILGRFTSADPFIQAPTDIQSFNRYSYVRNNPLSMTDPTGFFSVRKWLKKHAKDIVGAMTFGQNWGTWRIQDKQIKQSKTWRTIYGVAAAVHPGTAALYAAYATRRTGGTWREALISAYFAGMTSAIGSEIDGIFPYKGALLKNMMAHGVLDGTFTVMQGGEFRDGFLRGAGKALVMPQVMRGAQAAWAKVQAMSGLGLAAPGNQTGAELSASEVYEGQPGIDYRHSFNNQTGEFVSYDTAGKIVGQEQGYAGAPGFVNDSFADHLTDLGPIPRGDWQITRVTGSKGPLTIELAPYSNNTVWETGRAPMTFRIHGDNASMNFTASEGCIILSPQMRQTVTRIGGVLRVVGP